MSDETPPEPPKDVKSNEETKAPPAEAGAAQQAAPPEPTTEELAKRVANIEATRISMQKAELLEIEQRMDKKMKDFKAFVADTEVQGRSLASAPEKSEDQKAEDAAKALIEGSGLNPFAEPEEKKKA